jgi:hypothetical protein
VYGVVFSGKVEDESLIVDASRTEEQRAKLKGQSASR